VRKSRSFYDLLEMFPPCQVRLLARERYGKPLTAEQIATSSGLSQREVGLISQMVTWQDVDVEALRRFTHGCGLDLDKPASVKRKLVYLRGQHYTRVDRVPPSFRYLRRSPDWVTFYKPLIVKWTAYVRAKVQKT
jgi:hypothetical protein